MGTLGNQPPRKYFDLQPKDLEAAIVEFKEIGKKHGLNFDQVIAVKTVLELERRNDIAVQDGDYRDEQAGGIGDRLTAIAEAIESMKTPEE